MKWSITAHEHKKKYKNSRMHLKTLSGSAYNDEVILAKQLKKRK